MSYKQTFVVSLIIIGLLAGSVIFMNYSDEQRQKEVNEEFWAKYEQPPYIIKTNSTKKEEKEITNLDCQEAYNKDFTEKVDCKYLEPGLWAGNFTKPDCSCQKYEIKGWEKENTKWEEKIKVGEPIYFNLK